MSDATPRASNKETQDLLILSGVVDFALGILKVIVGWFASSHALIADGVHSISDLATDIMVWLFNRIGIQEPDDDHPYGHARFETFGTFILGCLLIVVAGFIVYESAARLMTITEVRVPGWPALVAALVSIAAKEWLFQITTRVGERTRSKLLVANAWHHRSDSLSSIIVFVGVGGAILGFVWLEMLAAIGVALMIGQIGWRLARQSVEELVDTAQSEAYVEDIQASISMVEGVRGVHNIRTRRMGPDVLVEVHLQVEPNVSVSEGHHIGEWVSKQLLGDFEDVSDVIVHIDAEDDEYMQDRDKDFPIAPLRKEVRESLLEAWRGRIDPMDIKKMTLHYLNNGINVELFLAKETLDDPLHNAEVFQAELLQLGKDLPWLRRVTVWWG